MDAIGKRDITGAVTSWPLRFATGQTFNPRVHFPSTMVMLDALHFYCLPVGVGRVSDERHAELLASIAPKKGKSPDAV